MTWYSSTMPLPPCMSRGDAGDIQRLAAVVALHQADHLRRRVMLVHQPAEPQHRMQAQRDLGLHVGQLLLDQLRRRQRPAEHLALQRVVARARASRTRPRPARPRRCRSARC